MRRLAATAVGATIAVVLCAVPALAKGPTSVRITGPPVGTLDVGGDPGSGEPGSDELLGRLAEDAGLWVVGFGAAELTEVPPVGELGPRLRLEWTVPGPSGDDTVLQDLYPYADAGALTHTRAGQPYLGGARTDGGWFVGGDALLGTLVEAGVPADAPAGRSSGSPVAAAAAGVLAVAIASAAIAATLRRRNRRRSVAAPAHP